MGNKSILVTGGAGYIGSHVVKQLGDAGEDVILVRRETSPEDVDGMNAAVGILTSTGGATSHAAVVARGWGKCCVAGAGDVHIDEKGKKFKVGKRTFTAKDVISLDGTTGEVMSGETVCAQPDQTVEECMAVMTDKTVRHLPVLEDNKVIGIISIGDLVKSVIRDQKFVIEQLEHYLSA